MYKRFSSQPFQSVTTGALFKIGLYSNLAIWGVFGLIIGLLGIFGIDAVKWNGEYLHGPSALVMGLIVATIFALLGTFMLLIGGLIARWFSRWLPLGTLEFHPTNDAQEGEADEAA